MNKSLLVPLRDVSVIVSSGRSKTGHLLRYEFSTATTYGMMTITGTICKLMITSVAAILITIIIVIITVTIVVIGYHS
jgi:hypothetical protein